MRFNIEYLGSLPIGTLTSYMMWLGYLRYTGHFKDRWTMKERLALIKSETQIEKNQSIARPVGLLSVGDLEGKHLRSRDLGLPGSFYVCVLYDPLRYADEKVRATQIKLDSANGCTHEIGATVSPGITSNPVWSHLHESSEFMRLKHLLPDDRLWREEEEADSSLSYPILQPITDDGGYIKEDNNESTYQSGVQLMPFESSLGAVVFQVRFSDVLGSFQLFDNVMGEVVLPISKLALSGRAVEGWFRLLPVGTKDTVPGESRDEDATKSVSSGESTGESKNTGDGMPPIVDFPELYLRAKFSSNGTLSNGAFQSDVETSSKVICEELSRTAEAAQDNSVGVIGTSLNTINTVRTLGGKLQNQISYIVDMLERVRNAFNFSVSVCFDINIFALPHVTQLQPALSYLIIIEPTDYIFHSPLSDIGLDCVGIGSYQIDCPIRWVGKCSDFRVNRSVWTFLTTYTTSRYSRHNMELHLLPSILCRPEQNLRPAKSRRPLKDRTLLNRATR